MMIMLRKPINIKVVHVQGAEILVLQCGYAYILIHVGSLSDRKGIIFWKLFYYSGHVEENLST